MVSGLEYDPEKTDLWSAGVTLYNMLTGKLPFIDRNIKDLYKKIVDGSVEYPSFLSRDASDLLQGILKTNPKSRMSFKEVFSHQWMQKYKPPGYPIVMLREKVARSNTGRPRSHKQSRQVPRRVEAAGLQEPAAAEEERLHCSVGYSHQLFHRLPSKVQKSGQTSHQTAVSSRRASKPRR